MPFNHGNPTRTVLSTQYGGLPEAPAENRNRVARMADEHATTRPNSMLIFKEAHCLLNVRFIDNFQTTNLIVFLYHLLLLK